MRVSGKDRRGRHFREHCETIVVSAHGALLRVSRALDLDAMLTLTNPVTFDEQECRVAYVGNESEESWRIGIEFLTPAPHFWGVEFAQADWGAAPPSSKN